MTREEVLFLMRRDGLLRVVRDGMMIRYVEGKDVFYDGFFHSEKNVFGVYYDVAYDKFIFFITGEERGGMIDYWVKYDTEDLAYEAMYEYLLLLK